MRRVLKLLAVLRRHERLVVSAVLGLGVATMVAHWWGTTRLPPAPPAAHLPAAGASRAGEPRTVLSEPRRAERGRLVGE